MKKLLFIINPKAGRTTIKGKLYDIIEQFAESGYQIVVHPTQGPNDATRIVVEEGDDYDLIVAAGGDGTLDNVVTGMIVGDINAPLGYIPSGTTNDFARSLDIPREALIAAEHIVNGMPFPIDVGEFNGDYFVYVAAFGAFTEVSYSTPQVYKNYFGHAAYILEGIKSLTSIKGFEMKIVADNETYTGNFMYGMVTNSLSVGGFRNLSGKHVEFDDGLFEALFIKTPQNAIELQGIMNALLLNEINEDYMIAFKTSQVTIISEEAIAWTLDGEAGGEHTEVDIKNHQRKIEIMVQ